MHRCAAIAVGACIALTALCCTEDVEPALASATLTRDAAHAVFTAQDCWDGSIIIGERRFQGLIEMVGCRATASHREDTRSFLMVGPDARGRYRLPAHAQRTLAVTEETYLTLDESDAPPILHRIRDGSGTATPLSPLYDIAGWMRGYPKHGRQTERRVTPLELRHAPERVLKRLRVAERKTGRLIGAGRAWSIFGKCEQAGVEPTNCKEEQ